MISLSKNDLREIFKKSSLLLKIFPHLKKHPRLKNLPPFKKTFTLIIKHTPIKNLIFIDLLLIVQMKEEYYESQTEHQNYKKSSKKTSCFSNLLYCIFTTSY